MPQPIKRVKNMDQDAWNKIIAWGKLRGLDLAPTLKLLIELQLEREHLDTVGHPTAAAPTDAATDGRGGTAA